MLSTSKHLNLPKADSLWKRCGVSLCAYILRGRGAAVDLTVFNPLHSENHRTLMIGGALIATAVLGKFLAGYAALWIRGNKRVIGVGMIPRGEVGFIFAQMGLTSGYLMLQCLVLWP